MKPNIVYSSARFFPGLPPVVYPYKNIDFKPLTVTRQSNGKIFVATDTQAVTLHSDDTLRYDKNSGEIFRIKGASSYDNPFRSVIAGTKLSQKLLEIDYDGEIICSDYQHPFCPEDFLDGFNFNGIIPQGKYSVIILTGNNGYGMIEKIYCRSNAKTNDTAINFLRDMTRRHKTPSSCAFDGYRNDACVLEYQAAEEKIVRENLEIQLAKDRFAYKRRESVKRDISERQRRLEQERICLFTGIITESGQQCFQTNGKKLFCSSKLIIYGRGKQKNIISWERAFELGLLETFALSLECLAQNSTVEI